MYADCRRALTERCTVYQSEYTSRLGLHAFLWR
uniref:Uncharacterized protein n=1 Tax=Anguilla anguilla TaxID=7936 RepID=A0A0E9QSV1_ANGAN